MDEDIKFDLAFNDFKLLFKDEIKELRNRIENHDVEDEEYFIEEPEWEPVDEEEIFLEELIENE